MVQPRQVTVDDIVDLLKTGDQPVYTMNDIADEFGVSKETVRRRMPEVVERDGVREDQIGKANVYWWSMDESPPQDVVDEAYGGGDGPEADPKSEQGGLGGGQGGELNWGESWEVSFETDDGTVSVELEPEQADTIRLHAGTRELTPDEALNEFVDAGIHQLEAKRAHQPTGFFGWLVDQMYRAGGLSVRLSAVMLAVTLYFFAFTDATQAITDTATVTIILAAGGALLVIAAVAVRVKMWGRELRDELPWSNANQEVVER